MNPYDPAEIIISGKKHYARVLTLSGIPNRTMDADVFGRPLKAEKIQAICPECGLIIEAILPYSHNPPYTITCNNCIASEIFEEIIFFIDPLTTGRLRPHDLFSTKMTEDKIKTLTVNEEQRDKLFGFIDYEDVPEDNSTDLGIEDFDDEDLLD